MKRLGQCVLLAVAAASVALIQGCSSSSSPSVAPADATSNCLQGGNWTDANRAALNGIIGKYAKQSKVAIFDWDNTTQARDVGDASFSQMYVDGDIKGGKVPAAFMPSFTQDGKRYSSGDIVAYSNALGNYTNAINSSIDYPQNMFLAGLFGMIGMTVQQVSTVALQAYDNNAGMQDIGKNTLTQIGTGAAAAPRPFIYPEMVDLYGCLLSNGFRVHVASASDVWTVRAIVRNYLNPEIAAKFGSNVQLPAANVMGIPFMLEDTQTGELINDSVLVRSDTPEGKAYAAGDPAALSRYKITTINSGIAADDSGKPANVMQWVTQDVPVLVAGDSTGDFMDFTRAENRLWIARLTEPSLQQLVIPRYQQDSPGPWIVQPTLFNENPGFVSSQSNLDSRLPSLPPSEIPQITQSIGLLDGAGMLQGFQPPPTPSAANSSAAPSP